jgi:hypothetical protein
MLPRLSLILVLASVSYLRAGEEERRTFEVRVDNKAAGSHQILIQSGDDGSVSVSLQADVTVRIIITYKYAFRGTEIWKENKLVQLSSTTNDNGKKRKVSVEPTAEGWAVKADDKAFQVTGEPWPTTYWKLPPENRRGPNVTLFDADTGKLIKAKMEKVGVDKITLLGKAVDCMHYKLTGGVQVDLWYDGSDRMVRQESIEQGHRTVQELTRLQRD